MRRPMDIELFKAVKLNDIAGMERLIEDGADVDARDNGGRVPLHYACWDGYEGAARLLVEKGADVNAKEQRGWTPLHRACGRAHTNMVRMLIEAGADAEAKDLDGNTPLDLAMRLHGSSKAREQILALFRKPDSGLS